LLQLLAGDLGIGGSSSLQGACLKTGRRADPSFFFWVSAVILGKGQDNSNHPSTASSIMSSIKKVPPHVARELLRHVSPAGGAVGKTGRNNKAAAAADQQNGSPSSSSSSGNSNHHTILFGCLAFTGAAASIPLVATWWIGRLSDKEDPLSAAQVRRGAFLNSGSRDVGVDHNWNFATGEYKKETGYAVLVAEEESRLRGEFLATSASELQQHEHKLEAFAKGRGGRNGAAPIKVVTTTTDQQ
jgi:hypothetical protein